MVNSLIPVLRFPEFKEEEWNKDLLGVITSYVDYRGRAPEKSTEGAFLVTAKNIRKGFIDYETSKEYVPFENYNIVMSKGLPKIGDILFTTEAPLGNVCQVDDDKIALAQRVIKLRGNEGLNNDYLLHYMLSFYYQKLINRMAFGTTVLGISGKALRKTTIKFPTPTEQTKIATFLTAVDKRISLLQKKKAELEQYKKGVMQKLFSQTLRFKNDDGSDFEDWEVKSLGQIGETFNGLTGKTKVDFGIGKPYIQYMQIFSNSRIDTTNFGLVDVGDDENQSKVQFGDVFFTTSSETPNEIGMSSVLTEQVDDVYLNSFCFGYRPNSLEELVPEFSQFFFRSSKVRKEIIKLAQGSTRFNMSKVAFMKLKFDFPKKNEQQKIATFLSSVDSTSKCNFLVYKFIK